MKGFQVNTIDGRISALCQLVGMATDLSRRYQVGSIVNALLEGGDVLIGVVLISCYSFIDTDKD
jgi:hypothetical protein